MKTTPLRGAADFTSSSFVHGLFSRYPDNSIDLLDALTHAASVQTLLDKTCDSQHVEFWCGVARNGELMDTLLSQSDLVVHMAAESPLCRSIYEKKS